jgi:hypothetical protein
VAKDLIPRSVTPIVLEALQEFRAVGLVGPRQSGKSTLARELLADRWPADYLTLDDDATRAFALDDPRGFIERIERPTILDEIQRAPGLMLAVKIRLDSNNAPGQFLLTGSADLMRIRTIQDSLPGRVIYQDVWPLTQAEIERRSSTLLDQLFSGEIPAVRATQIAIDPYLDRFERGGFPGTFRRSNRARKQFFDGYIDSIVDRDIPDVSSLRTVGGPARLLRLLATRSAGLLNVASLARELQVDNKTVDHHLRLLRDFRLIRIHPPWFANLGSREIKAPKAYVADPGLLAALVGANRGAFEADRTLLGAFLETAVCMEIVRLNAVAQSPAEIFHYRDKKQREVDIILQHGDGRLVGIEVKAASSANPIDFNALRYLRDGFGRRFVAGIVLNAGEQTVRAGDRLAAMPIASLWTPSP